LIVESPTTAPLLIVGSTQPAPKTVRDCVTACSTAARANRLLLVDCSGSAFCAHPDNWACFATNKAKSESVQAITKVGMSQTFRTCPSDMSHLPRHLPIGHVARATSPIPVHHACLVNIACAILGHNDPYENTFSGNKCEF